MKNNDKKYIKKLIKAKIAYLTLFMDSEHFSNKFDPDYTGERNNGFYAAQAKLTEFYRYY